MDIKITPPQLWSHHINISHRGHKASTDTIGSHTPQQKKVTLGSFGIKEVKNILYENVGGILDWKSIQEGNKEGKCKFYILPFVGHNVCVQK